MATRCNVIIKKGNDVETIYHHWDGYPEGVGSELHYFIKDNMELATTADPLKFAHTLEEHDPSYETDESIHGDINYLYIIDCDKKEVRCYDIKKWDCPFIIVEKMIKGEEQEDDKYQKLVYTSSFEISTDDFENLIEGL